MVMTWWEILAVWLAGWLAAVRPSMRRTMLQVVCSKCHATAGWCEHAHTKAIRGSMFERTGGDVAWSVWIAAWWPVWLTWVVLTRTLRKLGAGVKTAVIRATPLTGPELERRITERDAEIARLTKLVSDGHLPVDEARRRAAG